MKRLVAEPEDLQDASKVRLDKWLWAARFYKTRSQATQAIAAGHIKIRGERAKAGHAVAVGSVIEIVKDQLVWHVRVEAVSDRRGKGADAARLYRETEESKKERERQVELMRASPSPAHVGRPTKRDRRAIVRFRNDDDG